MHIYIDIETLPDLRPGSKEAFIAECKPDKAPAMTKAELLSDLGIEDAKDWTVAKLQDAWLEQKGAEYAAIVGMDKWKSTGLNGGMGRVWIIGAAIDDDDPVILVDDNETRVLDAFNQLISDAWGRDNRGRPIFVGHNVLDFDLTFMKHRYMINGSKPHPIIPFDAKPWDDKVYDTMHKWNLKQKTSLDTLCKYFGIPGKINDVDGSMMYEMYASGRQDEAAEYCKNDVAITRQIHRRMTFI